MKISYKILVFGAIALSVGGCDLTMLPEHELAPEQYFTNESDLTLWSNQFYSDNLEAAAIADDGDFMIDNGLSGYITGSRNAASQTWSFSALRRINYLLEHLDQCPDRGIATRYEAVAKFFRAYFYFLKVRTYGDVPYYDRVLGSTDADVYKARDDRGYVMDRVLEDFDFAAKNLPGTWESGNTRVTKWAALAYASRAALYEGTFRKYHGLTDADKYLQQAAATAKEFITDSPFYLYKEGSEPYRDLFYAEDAKTCEVVLCRRYDKAFGVTHSVPYTIKFGRTSFTRRFMNHYLMADGSRFTDKEGWQTMPYSQETQNRDPRMAQTVLCPGYIQVGATTVTKCTLSSHTGYEPIKFVGTAANSSTSGASSSDWILMRAAEVYLNYAEAVAELGTITQNDLDISVNLIRKRVNMPAIDLTSANSTPDPYLKSCYPNVTQSAHTGVILEIRRERTVELVMEPPFRSWDLFRWNECKQALNYYVPYYGCYIPGAGTYDMDNDGTPDLEIFTDTATSTCPTKLQIGKDLILSDTNSGYIVGYSGVIHGQNWDDGRDYLWPIPAAQRTLNPALTQNPGWDDGLNF